MRQWSFLPAAKYAQPTILRYPGFPDNRGSRRFFFVFKILLQPLCDFQSPVQPDFADATFIGVETGGKHPGRVPSIPGKWAWPS